MIFPILGGLIVIVLLQDPPPPPVQEPSPPPESASPRPSRQVFARATHPPEPAREPVTTPPLPDTQVPTTTQADISTAPSSTPRSGAQAATPKPVQGFRIGGPYTPTTYGSDQEKIRYFAVTFRGDATKENAAKAIQDVDTNHLWDPDEKKSLTLEAGPLHRTRLAPDRHIALCCINDSRKEGENLELFCVIITLDDDACPKVAFGLKPDRPIDPISYDPEPGDVGLSNPPLRAKIETGGYCVEIFVERLPGGDTGFRFLKPH